MRTIKEYRYVIAASLMWLITVALVVGVAWMGASVMIATDSVDALSVAFGIGALIVAVVPVWYAWTMLLDEAWAVRYQRMLRQKRKLEAQRMKLGRRPR